MKSNALLYVGAAVVALLLGLGAARLLNNGGTQPAHIPGANLYPQAIPMPPFTLVDEEGKSFTNESLKGKWSFLFFGYTYCPDVCPMTLTVFREVAKQLAATPQGVDNTQFVFVSVDPNRDTPERLKEYVRYFNPDFKGVTGDEKTIGQLTSAIGIVYMKTPGKTDDDYLVDHSSAVLLVDPQGRRYAIFTAKPSQEAGSVGGHDPKVITNAFEIIRQSQGA